MNTDAYNAALRRLSVREYSAYELSQYLKKKGFAEDEAAEVLAELVRRKFVSDERFLRAMVRHHLGRGKGPAYIRAKLKQKGVNASTSEIRVVLGEVSDKSEVASAREIAERKYPGFSADRAIAAKAIQALLRRGFSYDIARQALSVEE